jgi:triosephosphate isomerase
MEQPEIDGALVGGASLKEADFTAIVRAAAEVVPSA